MIIRPSKAGYFFLASVIASLITSVVVSVMIITGYIEDIPLFLSIGVSEAEVLLPALLFTFFSGEDFREVFRFKKVRLTSLLLVIPLVMAMEPLVVILNSFTTMFSSNAAMELGLGMENIPFLEVAVMFAVVAPLAEEMAFRGFALSALRTSGRIFTSIVIQAFMFGCIHLNFNQFAYAFVYGLVFGVLSEVSGSIWLGFFGHAMVNFTSAAAMFIEGTELLKEEAAAASAMTWMDFFEIVNEVGFMSVLGLAGAFLLIYLIAKNEDGLARLNRMLHPRTPALIDPLGNVVPVSRPHAVTAPLVIGTVIAFAIMFLLG